MENNVNQAALVSLIIPVYNTDAYINQCLDSVIAQTYPSLEVLVVDDGSTDGSGSICDEYAKKDHRITVFHTENRGQAAARNYALDRMRGDYVAFMDSDDWLEINAIETMVCAALEHDADLVACQHCREWVNQKKESASSDHPVVLDHAQLVREFIDYKITNFVWDKLCRKEVFSGVRFPAGKYEDIATTYKLILKAEKAVVLNDVLYHYRQRASSTSYTYSIQYIIDYWEAYRHRTKALSGFSPESDHVLVGSCIDVIGQMWRWYEGDTYEKRNAPETKRVLDEMVAFVRQHFDEVMHVNSFTKFQKMICIFARSRNPIIMKCLNLANHFYKKSRKENFFD